MFCVCKITTISVKFVWIICDRPTKKRSITWFSAVFLYKLFFFLLLFLHFFKISFPLFFFFCNIIFYNYFLLFYLIFNVSSLLCCIKNGLRMTFDWNNQQISGWICRNNVSLPATEACNVMITVIMLMI